MQKGISVPKHCNFGVGIASCLVSGRKIYYAEVLIQHIFNTEHANLELIYHVTLGNIATNHLPSSQTVSKVILFSEILDGREGHNAFTVECKPGDTTREA